MDATGNVYIILGPEEETPAYIKDAVINLDITGEQILPAKPKWSTLFIAAGKKDKVNKIDIVGFFQQRSA